MCVCVCVHACVHVHMCVCVFVQVCGACLHVWVRVWVGVSSVPDGIYVSKHGA